MEGDDEDKGQGKPQPSCGGPVAFSVPVCRAGPRVCLVFFFTSSMLGASLPCESLSNAPTVEVLPGDGSRILGD